MSGIFFDSSLLKSNPTSALAAVAGLKAQVTAQAKQEKDEPAATAGQGDYVPKSSTLPSRPSARANPKRP